ncbi:MAG: ATPase, partial [Firmicutes bacterium]|nr:ATPase [Bacillota bacterium]
RRGFDAEAYYCPMKPEHKVEHVVIPELSLAFTTSNKYHSVDINTDKVVDLNGYIHKVVLEKHKDALKYDVETFDAILDKAVATIKEAKETHDVLETFYIPNMKFDEVQVCWEKTLARILSYAEEVS